MNQQVICFSAGKVFEAIVMSAFVDAGMVNYYVFSRTSAEPIVAQQLELQHFYSNGKQVVLTPGECESNPYQLPAAEDLSFPPVIEVKKEFPIDKKVNTFYWSQLFSSVFIHSRDFMSSVESVDFKNCKKEKFKKNKKKKSQNTKNFSGVGSFLACSKANLFLLKVLFRPTTLRGSAVTTLLEAVSSHF